MEKNLQTATFGGGCFWCTEAIFERLQGVETVRSGYAGGEVKNPAYREVCSGITGHAEVVQVVYDPEKIEYEDLIRIHLTTHDPTTLNQQGADVGTQYRSIILVHDTKQEDAAKKVISSLQKEAFDSPIVTEIRAFEIFYEAEQAHQSFYRSQPEYGYCRAVIDPKLAKFTQLYRDKLKSSL